MPQWLVIGISGVTCGGKTTLAQTLSEYFLNQRNVNIFNIPYTISDVKLISQDDYFLPVDDLRHKWVEPLNVINFELITSLDMKQMVSDVTWSMKGHSLWDSSFDNSCFSNHISAFGGIFKQFSTEQNQIVGTHQSKHFSNLQNLTKSQYNKYMQQQHYNYQNHHHHNHINKSSPEDTSYIMHINSQITTQLRDKKINILIIEGFMIFNQPELITLCNIKFHFHLPYEKCFQRRRKRTYDPPDVTGYFEMCVWPHYENNFMEFRNREDITFLNGEISKDKIFTFVLQRIAQYFDERCDVACPPPHKFLGMPSCNNRNIRISPTLQAFPKKDCK